MKAEWGHGIGWLYRHYIQFYIYEFPSLLMAHVYIKHETRNRGYMEFLYLSNLVIERKNSIEEIKEVSVWLSYQLLELSS